MYFHNKTDNWKAILDRRNIPIKDMDCNPVQGLMSMRTIYSLPTANVQLEPNININISRISLLEGMPKTLSCVTMANLQR